MDTETIKKKLGPGAVFDIGEENTAFAEFFDGKSYLSMLSSHQVGIANVTFEPGCRNHWHIHKATEGGGQILLVTAGRGWYQEWGKEARKLCAGDTVHIPPNVKHWHGAAKDSWFQHIAIEVPAEGAVNEWMEAVDRDDYDKLK